MRITPTGAFTYYTNPDISLPHYIAPGPDGNLWFTTWSGIATVQPGRTPSESFVTAAYHDFLGRAPTPAELDAWTSVLDTGTSRDTLTAQLANSPEWVSNIVTQLYANTLNRPPDPAGLNYWVTAITTHTTTVAATAAYFYASDEYFTTTGGDNNTTWITDLYTKILHRPTDPAGLTYWTNTTTTQGRLTVAYAIYQSTESRADRVTTLYNQLLGRPAEPAGLTYWATQLETIGDVTLAANLADSNEYLTHAQTRYP